MAFGYQILGFGSGGVASFEVTDVDYLVIAGGGSGGTTYGGGGGAGGFRTSFCNACAAALTVCSGCHSITVGGGGAQVDPPGACYGNVGNDSTFATITSAGGGFGGIYPATPAAGDGG